MSTVIRLTFRNKNLLGWASLLSLIKIPPRSNKEEFLGFIGQIAGILWGIIGIIIFRLPEIFSSSILGIILEPFLVLIPFILVVVSIRYLYKNNK
jgi:hypothetical protein